jgi:CheY-like chemotaxis protein
MPEFSGTDLIQQLVQDNKINDTPIVVLTASSPSVEYEDSLVALGVKIVLKKPIDPDILHEYIEKIVQK